MQIRIYYKHTDAGGIVYHSNYIDFCEMARSELFFEVGMSPTVDGCHFALKSLQCDFVNVSKLGDLLDVSSEVRVLKNASFEIYHEIKREEVLIFTMSATLLFLCEDGKIRKIPQDYRRFFETFIPKDSVNSPTK
jgi:acyl-CoA thioester hydrolase